jgi:hypothetical protein
MLSINTFIKQLRSAADALEALVETGPTKRIGSKATAKAILQGRALTEPPKPKALHWTQRPEHQATLKAMVKRSRASRLKRIAEARSADHKP